MNAKYFLDTNLLVYAFDQKELQKQAIAKRYLNALFTQETHVLSLQVLHEFVAVAQKKLAPPMTPEDLNALIQLIPGKRILPLTRRITIDALQIQQQYQLSWWDSLIVASAKWGGCTFIVTEDLSDGQKIENITIFNPFNTTP